jgi:hypothetical protein
MGISAVFLLKGPFPQTDHLGHGLYIKKEYLVKAKREGGLNTHTPLARRLKKDG